jgi:hypothetical protein
MAGAPAVAGTRSLRSSGGPVVTASPSTVAPGQKVQVSGSGFPPQIDVTGQICGNNGVSGSADCVLTDTVLATTSTMGDLTLSIAAVIPPVPCPCVVAITSTDLSGTPSAPVTIAGAPIAPVRPPASAATVTKPLEILQVQLGGNGPWYAWFGGVAHRTLTLTVRNPNAGVYPHPPLVLSAGKAGTLSTVSTRPLPSLAPGEVATVHENVVFPAFSFGRNEVTGTVGNALLQKNVYVSTTVVPWGLIVLGLIILQLILVAIRNALRRRHLRQAASPPGSPPPPPPPPSGSDGPTTPPDDSADRASREDQRLHVG